MRSRWLTRRGGALPVTAGHVAVAGSVAALLAAGPRALGAEPFAGLALAWTVSAVFGYGLAVPAEQVLSRNIAAGQGSSSLQRPDRWLGAAAVLAVLLVGTLGWVTAGGRSGAVMLPAAALGIVGWTVTASVRGRLAGLGDLWAYSGVLVAEAVLRLGLVAAAVLWPPGAAALLAAAIGLPLALAGLAHLVLPAAPSGPRSAGTRGVHASVVAVALSFQVCATGAALLLAAGAGVSPREVGAFVLATSYYRLPTVLAAGQATHALVALSRAWAGADRVDFNRLRRRLLLQTAAASTAVTVVTVLAGPVLLRWLYGQDPDLPAVVVAGLAVSTVILTVAVVAQAPLLAAARGRSAAGCWMAGAAVQTGLLLSAERLDALVAAALVAGPVSALVGLLAATARARTWTPAARPGGGIGGGDEDRDPGRRP